MIRSLPLVWLAALLLGGCANQTDPAYIAEIDAWHQGRLDRLRQDDGWLTLVGLHPLHLGSNVLGSQEGLDVQLIDKAPPTVGIITISEERMLFTAHPGVDVFPAGAETDAAVSSQVMVPDDPGPPSILRTGSLLFHVIARGDRHFLRVKDTEAEVLQQFSGIDRFPVDQQWRLEARIEAGPATMKVPNVLGQVEDVSSPGYLVFEIGGEECRLQAQGKPGAGLFIVYGDATNGKTTYPGGRFLSTGPPGPDGTVILDFNRSVNPPCVFTPYATCPLPTVDNLLDVAVEAGEMVWGESH